jgi:hypothetical protein
MGVTLATRWQMHWPQFRNWSRVRRKFCPRAGRGQAMAYLSNVPRLHYRASVASPNFKGGITRPIAAIASVWFNAGRPRARMS